MTTLAIVPNHDKKRLKLTGTVAAGEHVAVTIKDGWAWASAEGAAFRLRVVFAGKLLAEFPRRVEEGEETPVENEWTQGAESADAECILNFNTIPAAKWLIAGGNCLWVLDDPELNTLYGVGDLEVMPWHRAPGGEVPYNLDGYPDFVEEAKAAIEQAANAAQAAANAASASQVAATQARNAATESRNSAANQASAAAESASNAQSSAVSAAGSAASAAENASLATRAAIAKMRERTGSRLWHNVALSQNERGQWVMDVDQEAGGDDGAFDADVKALGTTEARSLASRFADVVNVKDFGAVGDGVTDDYRALKSWLDYLCANGGAGYMPKGVYYSSRMLLLGSSSSQFGWNKPFSIHGAGRGSTKIKVSSSANQALAFYACSGVEICDITIDAGRATMEVATNKGASIYCLDCSDFSLKSVSIVGFEQCGLIAFLGGTREVYSRNWILDDCIIDGTSCFNPEHVGVDDTYHSGMILTSVHDSVVVNTRAVNCTSYGLEYKGNDISACTNCKFIGCSVENCNRGGLYFGGQNAPAVGEGFLHYGVVVSGCSSHNCVVGLHMGWVARSEVTGLLIDRDDSYPFAIGASDSHQVFLRRCEDVSVNASVYGIDCTPIDIRDSTKNCIVELNGLGTKSDNAAINLLDMLLPGGQSDYTSDCTVRLLSPIAKGVLTPPTPAMLEMYEQKNIIVDWRQPKNDVINVKDFGAKGDGTTDDTTAIQAAVSAATVGSTVCFPKGTYKVEGTIVVTTSNITIDGGGALVVKQTTGPVFAVEGRMINSSKVNIAASANDHASSITVSDASGFSVGDWLYVKSLRSAFDPVACGNEWVLGYATSGSPDEFFAEPAQICGIDGDVLYLTKPLVFPFYPAERESGVDDPSISDEYSTVRRMEFVENVVIRNFGHEIGTVEDDDDKATSRARYGKNGYIFARLVLCHGVIIEDIASNRRAVFNENVPTPSRPLMAIGATVSTCHCLRCTFRNISVTHEHATGKTGSGSEYSAFHIRSSWYCTIDSCSDTKGYDGVDETYVVMYPRLFREIDAETQSYVFSQGQDDNLRGPSIYTSILDSTFDAPASDAVVNHAGMYRTTMDRCRVYGAGASGFDCRCIGTVISNCLFDNSDYTIPPAEDAESESGKTTVAPLHAGSVQLGVRFRPVQKYVSGVAQNNETPFFRESLVIGCRFVGCETAVYVQMPDPKSAAFGNLDLLLRDNDFYGCNLSVYFVPDSNGDYSDWASRADGTLGNGDSPVPHCGVEIRGNRFYDSPRVLFGGYCRGLSFVGNTLRRCGAHASGNNRYAVIPASGNPDSNVAASVRDVSILDNTFIDSGSPTVSPDTGISYDIRWMDPSVTRARFRGNKRVGEGYGYACNNMVAYTAENDMEGSMLTRLAALEAAVFPQQSQS